MNLYETRLAWSWKGEMSCVSVKGEMKSGGKMLHREEEVESASAEVALKNVLIS